MTLLTDIGIVSSSKATKSSPGDGIMTNYETIILEKILAVSAYAVIIAALAGAHYLPTLNGGV